jgi:hypothetical protein
VLAVRTSDDGAATWAAPKVLEFPWIVWNPQVVNFPAGSASLLLHVKAKLSGRLYQLQSHDAGDTVSGCRSALL